MNLHGEIMNLDCLDIDSAVNKYGFEHRHLSYRFGHRDARHAAAQLSLKAYAYIEQLEYYVRKMAGNDILQEIKQEVGIDY